MGYAISSWLLDTCTWHDSANYFDPNPLKVKIAPDYLVGESASSQTLIASSIH